MTTSIITKQILPNGTKCFTYSGPKCSFEYAYVDSIVKIIEFYTNEPYPLSNIGQGILSNNIFTYSYNSGGTVNVEVEFSLVSPFSGTFTETGAITNSGVLTFIGNVGTFTDSGSNDFVITINSYLSFTIQNTTAGYIYDSTTGKITPV